MRSISKQIVFLALLSIFGAPAVALAKSSALSGTQQAGDSGYIKPHAPVDVVHKVLGPAIPGQPVDIEIVVLPGKFAEGVSAEIRPGTGMRESRRGRVERVSDAGHPMAYRQVFTFVPSVEGVHHITVFAAVQVDGVSQGRVVSLPVQVGKSTAPVRKMLPVPGEVKPDGEGGLVRELPAQKTITVVEPE